MSQPSRRAALHIPTRNDAAAVVVYGIAHGGAGAAPWNAVARSAPIQIEIRGVRLPGREKRRDEIPHPSIASAAAEVADILAADAPAHGRPVLVTGVCSGALIGLSALAMLPRPLPVAGLVVARQSPPNLVASEEPPAAMSSGELRTWLRQQHLTPPILLNDDKLFASLEPLLRADLLLTDGYLAPTVKLSCPVYLVETASSALSRPYLQGWQDVTLGPVRVLSLPGSGDPLTDHADHLAAAIGLSAVGPDV